MCNTSRMGQPTPRESDTCYSVVVSTDLKRALTVPGQPEKGVTTARVTVRHEVWSGPSGRVCVRCEKAVG